MGKIVGYEKERKEIAQLREMLKNSARYRKYGIRIPRGIVLYGEPGVGKTALAKSIAADGISLIELRAANCCEEDAVNELKAVFERAKNSAPAVILLDELDKIAGTSESFMMEMNDSIKKALLQELDGLNEDDDVLVAATCNDTDSIGEALLRPGRFDRRLHIEAPDEATRRLIVKEYFDRLKMKNDVDYGYIAKITYGYTGAKIECLANETGILAAEKETPVVFLLWGANAEKKARVITNPIHKKLITVHPSPLSAYRGFFGCRHFSKANEILISSGQSPIEWNAL